jgi:hypothetical protein
VNRDHDRAILPLIAGIALLLVGALLLWPSHARAAEPPSPFDRIAQIVRGQLVDDGLVAENQRLRAKLRREHRANVYHAGIVRRLKHTLRLNPIVSEAINLAATVYRVSSSMLWRRALCESHGWRYARNRSSNASGLFQFLPSTFASTPFSGFSIWSAYANALAAGWMMGPAGRGGEWACR